MHQQDNYFFVPSFKNSFQSSLFMFYYFICGVHFLFEEKIAPVKKFSLKTRFGWVFSAFKQ